MKKIGLSLVVLFVALSARCQSHSSNAARSDTVHYQYQVVHAVCNPKKPYLDSALHLYQCDFHIDKPDLKHLPTTQTVHIVKLAPAVTQTTSNSPLIPVGGRPADILYVIDDMRIMRN